MLTGGIEIAWDGAGNYCGDPHPASRRKHPPEPRVEHQCSAAQRPECGVFICSTCDRAVPWCFGGSDSTECDDCAVGQVAPC